MAKQVLLTPLAAESFDAVLEYLKYKWSDKVANDFIIRFRHVYQHIANNPEIYPIINKATGLQKCVLTKHNVLYFKQVHDRIFILDVFNTRQNPDKLMGRF